MLTKGLFQQPLDFAALSDNKTLAAPLDQRRTSKE
jgi:hypothetical protein